MKREEICDIISMTDKRFIEEAAAIKKKKRNLPAFIGAAACFIVAAAAILALTANQSIPKNTQDTTVGAAVGESVSSEEIGTAPSSGLMPEIEIATEPAFNRVGLWSELLICEKYRELTFDGHTYSAQLKTVDEKYVLSHLGDCEITGYDHIEEKTYYHNVSVYSLNGMKAEYVVAVKYADEVGYYLFMNYRYEPETLGDFISDLDLRNTLVFAGAQCNTHEYGNNFYSQTHKVYEDFDDTVIWNMLLNDTSAKNVQYNMPYTKLAEITVSIPALGIENRVLCITADGYIITNVADTQKAFFIGTDKADAFMEYLNNNVRVTENSVVYETYPYADSTEEAQSTPGFNPNSGESVPPYDPGSGKSGSDNTTDFDTVEMQTTILYVTDYPGASTAYVIPKNADEPASVESINPSENF